MSRTGFAAIWFAMAYLSRRRRDRAALLQLNSQRLEIDL